MNNNNAPHVSPNTDSFNTPLTSRTLAHYVIAAAFLFILLVFMLVSCQQEEPTARGGEAQAVASQCSGDEIVVRLGPDGRPLAICIDDDTPVPTETPTLEPTATATVPTFTPIPSNTATPEPTATHVHPTETPTMVATMSSTVTATPPAQAGQECPTWVHALHVTTGPDGNTYPTWHPSIDPIYGCYFAHTHGDDPRTSSVIQTMPAFGYVNAVAIAGGQAHMPEAHAGFKVFNFECGEAGDQGANRIASRFVMHMGSSGTMRYTMAFHSIEYDAAACDGSWQVALKGMANFGADTPIGDVCDNPRQGGRDFSTLGCVEAGKPELAYEIWGGHFSVRRPGEFDELFQSRVYVQLVPALFDPVTTVNPDDLTQVIYTADVVYPNQFDPLSQRSPFQGCLQETYQGPLSLNNLNRPTRYITDVFGVIQPDAIEGDPGTLVQFISAVRVDGAAANASANGTQFKKTFDFCTPFLHPPN